MPHAVQRRRCPQCQQVREFQRPQQKTCSNRCRTAARRYGPPESLVGLGLLTEREQAIYERGRKNGFRVGQAVWTDRGYRKGWAEALGEERDPRGRRETRAA